MLAVGKKRNSETGIETTIISMYNQYIITKKRSHAAAADDDEYDVYSYSLNLKPPVIL